MVRWLWESVLVQCVNLYSCTLCVYKTVLERWRGNSQGWCGAAFRLGMEERLAGWSQPSSRWKRWVISTTSTTCDSLYMFMPPPTIVGAEHYVFGSSVGPSVRPPDVCPSVRPLSINIYFAWRDITVHSRGFQWNSARIFIMLVGIAEKVFKVRGQRSRSKRNKMHFCGGWRHTFRPCGVEAQLFYIIILAFETLTSFLWSVYCNFSS